MCKIASIFWHLKGRAEYCHKHSVWSRRCSVEAVCGRKSGREDTRCRCVGEPENYPEHKYSKRKSGAKTIPVKEDRNEGHIGEILCCHILREAQFFIDRSRIKMKSVLIWFEERKAVFALKGTCYSSLFLTLYKN